MFSRTPSVLSTVEMFLTCEVPDFPIILLLLSKTLEWYAVPLLSFVTSKRAFLISFKLFLFKLNSPGTASFSNPFMDLISFGKISFPVAILAIMTASCKGDDNTYPWPIDELTVSPTTHSLDRAFCFQSLSGTMPDVTADISILKDFPKPRTRATSAIFSMPTL